MRPAPSTVRPSQLETAMTLQEILRVKGTQIYTIFSDATLKDAVDEMVERNVSSLVVCNVNPQVATAAGIITERDVLRCVNSCSGGLEEIYVSEVMTTELITASLLEQ